MTRRLCAFASGWMVALALASGSLHSEGTPPSSATPAPAPKPPPTPTTPTAPPAPPAPTALPTTAGPVAQAGLDPRPQALEVGPPLGGFDQPVALTHADDGSGRIFVVEQTGLVRVVLGKSVLPTPFLDARGWLGASAGEQGLLGLAFHPDFRRNRRLFIAYTDRQKRNAVAELIASKDGSVVDDQIPRVLLAIDDPASNHNGGHLLFGPGGKLWVGTGDGGGANDPWKTSQDPSSHLGKMLLLDVDAPGSPGSPLPEKAITRWARGLRNPWRYAFDAAAGDLWIADVGQNAWEEVNVIPGDALRQDVVDAYNFGWSTMEGFACFRGDGCQTTGLTLPVFTYGHGRSATKGGTSGAEFAPKGCSVTGGVVVGGVFLFSDYCSGEIYAIRREGRRTWVQQVATTPWRISSFGVDEDGRAWVVGHAGGGQGVIAPLRSRR